MTDKYVKRAREILADEAEKVGWPPRATSIRAGRFDEAYDIIALARVLRIHAEKQPTFEQRVAAMRQAETLAGGNPVKMQEVYDAALTEIIAPKPVDPLVDAFEEIRSSPTLRTAEEMASDLRRALAARGIKIPEVQG